ncbi:hypothetical protein CTAYLR_002203 [Chrysophaeum taylorii]|uniref:Uncharacterized protein n=1 Tax=Chrysophaeum taylorii TaxID=2483200 RepID=A0AAD7XU93_9STRA|nr:hypothetical protein CTAYLR_002203 [Chrysophaeum taylorii]
MAVTGSPATGSRQMREVVRHAEAVDKNGNRVGVMKTLDDGTKVQENDNGVKIEILTDGTRIQHNPDGIVIQSNPDGSKIQRNPDGKQIDTSPDGTQIQTNPDGTQLKLKSSTSNGFCYCDCSSAFG